jgi:hypothetical protein
MMKTKKQQHQRHQQKQWMDAVYERMQWPVFMRSFGFSFIVGVVLFAVLFFIYVTWIWLKN